MTLHPPKLPISLSLEFARRCDGAEATTVVNLFNIFVEKANDPDPAWRDRQLGRNAVGIQYGMVEKPRGMTQAWIYVPKAKAVWVLTPDTEPFADEIDVTNVRACDMFKTRGNA